MTIRRGPLYFGVFLVAAGGVTLLAAAGLLDRARVVDVLAYWPLAFIAIGVGLVLRRTGAAVPGGMLAAAVPGLMLGGMLVAVPDLPTPCTDGRLATATPVTRQGAFGATARVDLELSCGELGVSTATGSAWSVVTRTDDGRAVDVAADAGRLSVSSPTDRHRFGWDSPAARWDVTLPTATTVDLDTTINAGRGRLDLAGARLGLMGLDVNAGEVRVDLSSAAVNRLDVTVNAGAATVDLPSAGDLTGDLTVNAGSLKVCVPASMGLKVTSSAALGSVDLNGLTRRGDAWVTPGYTTAQSHADLTVSASVGSVDINTEGVCK